MYSLAMISPLAAVARVVSTAAVSKQATAIGFRRIFGGTASSTTMTAADVLKRKLAADHATVISSNASAAEAIRQLARGNDHALIVAAADHSVVGIVTSHDVIQALSAATDLPSVLHANVQSIMTGAATVVHVAPDDSVTQCALLMSELHVNHLPVITGGEV
jgi:CBS domain-containing protein